MSGQITAKTVIFDFESPDAVKAAEKNSDIDTLARSTVFSTSGEYGLAFSSPVYVPGRSMPARPAFKLRPELTDWSDYDRLVIDIANLEPYGQKFDVTLFSTHPSGRAQQYLVYNNPTPCSVTRLVLGLYHAPGHTGSHLPVNPAKIEAIGFSTYAPQKPLTVYIDSIVLLKKGEAVDPIPTAAKQQIGLLYFGKICQPKIDQIWAAHKKARQKADLLSKRPDRDTGTLNQWLTDVSDKLDSYTKTMKEVLTEPEQLTDIDNKLPSLATRCQRVEAIADYFLEHHSESSRILAFAEPTVKIRPRDGKLPIQPLEKVSLELAKNETESFQVVALPLSETLKDVRVSIDPLQDGNLTTQVEVVGFVNVQVTDMPEQLLGWWPDPLLNFIDTTDVAPCDAQSFWVRVKSSTDSKPGSYKTTVRVHSNGEEIASVPVAIEVRNFAMPLHSPLPMAHNTVHEFIQKLSSEEKWKTELKDIYVDFYADYFINYGSLYSNYIDWDVILKLKKRDRLATLNLGYLNHEWAKLKPDMTDADWQAVTPAIFAHFDTNYENAKKYGLLDISYIYTFDEMKPHWFKTIEHCVALLKERYPGVRFITTARGNMNDVDAIDIWTPLSDNFSKPQAEQARAVGKDYWWYFCVSKIGDVPNMFIESNLLGSRLFTGAMTWKLRPGGFLYYYLCHWPNNKAPITTGPFTNWNPTSFSESNGDGSWVCPGPGVKPLATVRLEAFRDGLEDYAAACILDATINKAKASPELSNQTSAWIKKAEFCLSVPDSLVKKQDDYTRDPRALKTWRKNLYRAISTAPIEPANPWPNGLKWH